MRPFPPGGSGAGGYGPLSPQVVELWTRAKLLPPEPGLTVLLRAAVRVTLHARSDIGGEAEGGAVLEANSAPWEAASSSEAAVEPPLPSEPLPSEPLPSEPLPSEPLPSASLPSVPMVLLLTATRLFLEKRSALALQAPLTAVAVLADKSHTSHGTVVEIAAVVATGTADEQRRRLTIHGLSTGQRATLTSASQQAGRGRE